MAKSNTSPWMIGIGIAIILALFGGFYMVSQDTEQTQLAIGGDCSIAPTIDLTVFNADEDKQGTEITGVDTYLRINGIYQGNKSLGDQTFARGDEVEILLSKSDYLDKKMKVVAEDCGINYATDSMYATSANTFKVKNTDGTSVLTDSADGGAVNQSSSTSSMSFATQIDSTTDESSGELIVVVETNDTEVDSIILSGFDGAEKVDEPDFYSAQGTSPTISKAFSVPAILDGASVYGTLKLDPESGATIGAVETPVYITAYSKQAFVENDGTYGFGVEDSNSNAKYEDTFDYDFLIKA